MSYFLGNALYPYFEERLQALHGDQPIAPALMDIYETICERPTIGQTELNDLVNQVQKDHLPELSYSQVQKRLLMAMGYRTPGLAQQIRDDYNLISWAKVERHYPVLWNELLNVPYEHSVFSYTNARGVQKYLLPYLELLFEPVLRGYRSVECITEPEHQQAFGIVLYLSKQKTMDMRGLRLQAEYLQQILKCSHHTSLNVAALAMGFPTWTAMRPHVVEDSISNARHQWKLPEHACSEPC